MSTIHKDTYKSKYQDWRTPIELIKAVLEWETLDRFNMDVACSDMLIPALRYGMADRICDVKGYTNTNFNGLTAEWQNDCTKNAINWMNPPFDQAKDFIKKAHAEIQNDVTTWAILPADRTNTIYYQKYVMPNELMFYFQGKFKFWHPEAENQDGCRNPIMLTVFTNNASYKLSHIKKGFEKFMNKRGFKGVCR